LQTAPRMQHRGTGACSRVVAVILIATIACGPSGGGRTITSGGGGGGSNKGNPPSNPTVAGADEAQAGFTSPVNNYGAFVQKIPIAVPEGLPGLTPEIALVYSSRGGLGSAGAGWDLPLPAVTLNLGDGVRPASVAADVERFEPGEAVERYSTNLGTLAIVRDTELWEDATPTYLISPFNDQVVKPIPDEHGAPNLGSDEAAWSIALKDGTTYRYGFTDRSSLIKNASSGEARKVAWYLDRVEDRHGNRMNYYYEEYPNQQGRFRQPTLRAIEYGIPARDPEQRERIVVAFEYIEAPDWLRSSFNFGTRVDSRFFVNRICTYANTHVDSYTTGGRYYWRVDDVDGVEQTVRGPCTELTYDFEDLDGDGTRDYPASYTSRPLLMKVQTVAADGSRLPPWEMTYEQQGRPWTDPYQNSLAAGGEPLSMPAGVDLQRSTQGLEQMAIDLDSDGAVDFLSGRTDGTFDVQRGALIDADGDGRLDAYAPGDATTWPNPLRDHAEPATLSATMNDDFRETQSSDCWWYTDFHASWSAAAGDLAYARSLTAAPMNFASIYDDATDEAESQYLQLGGFQFLQSSFVAPMPAIGDESVLNAAETFDELFKYGSFKSNHEEVSFDYRASDCRDWGDRWGVDHCWEIDGTSDDGSLGNTLGCLDAKEPRYLTTTLEPLSAHLRGYTAGLWQLQDLDGDGLPDLVFAAPVIQADGDGMRNFGAGDNDWYWSRNVGTGWDAPSRWTMPSKLGADLGLTGVDKVHATGFLSAHVTSQPMPARAGWGVSASFGLGAGGFFFSPALVLGGHAVGIPTGAIARGDLAAIGRSAVLQGVAAGAAAAGVSQVFSAGTTMAGLSAAAASDPSFNTGDAIGRLAPAIFFKVSATSNGVEIHPYLPIVGDVLQYALQHDESRQHWVQGTLDLDADGRADLVSARWDAGASSNGTGQWLFYRNASGGFDEPTLWSFAQPPTTPSSTTPDGVPPASGAISATQSVNFTKVAFEFPNNSPKRGYGVVYETYGLVDVNGDGLTDYVDGNPYVVDGEFGWFVHFNEGDRFGHPEFWPFAGDWQTVHGEPGCDLVLTAPRINESVYGQPDLKYPTAVVPAFGYSRQVQGLADIDRDGDPDYWYEEPYRTDEADAAVCAYTHLWDEEADFLESVAPRLLRRRLLVRRNDGEGFGLPEEWVPDTGFALSGGSVSQYHQGSGDPPKVTTTVQVATGDFDVDGGLDLAVEDEDGWHSFALTAPNPDVLSTITTPTGGMLTASYRIYAELGGGMGAPVWVLDRVVATDPTGASATVERSFEYEHGVFDRTERAFLGFERVQEHATTGYTLSRYYQAKGYEGQLYCREVRTLADAEDALRTTRRNHETAWAGGVAPSGHRSAVALGSPVRGSARPNATAADNAIPGGTDDGATADAVPAYGAEPPPQTDLPDEALEQAADTAEEDTWPDRGVRPPPDLAFGPGDTTYWTHDIPVVDSPTPGLTSPPELNTKPPGDFWDLDLYGDCETSGVTVGDITFYCDPEEITDDMLYCGDVDDPGLPVEAQFYVLQENGIDGVPAPRLMLTSEKKYNLAGAARVTRTELDYDELGNVVEVRDLGGTGVAGDELATTTEYTALNETDYLTGFPCHQQVTDGSGAVVRETWTGYDGAASGTCAMVTTGDATEIRRGVADGDDVIEAYLYNTEGMVRRYTDPKGMVTNTGFDPVRPWLKVLESKLVAAYIGPTILTRLWSYYGNGFSPAENFGLLYREVGYDGAIIEHAYDGFGRQISTILPEDAALQPSRVTAYTDWDTGDVPLRPALVERSTLRAGGIYSSATSRIDGWGRESRIDSTPPNNPACGPPMYLCDVVSAERSFDADGRIVEATLPYFDLPTTGERPHVATTYDLLGRSTQVIGANGATKRIAYDREFTMAEDADGVVTIMEADVRGKPRFEHAYVAGAIYATSETEYDALGQLVRITDDADNEWTFDYDRLGRKTGEHDPNTGDTTTLYDGNGNVREVIDERNGASGLVTRWMHDPLNRPVLRAVHDGLSPVALVETSVWAYDVNPGLLPDATITTCVDAWRGRLSRVETMRYETGAPVLASRRDYCYDDRGRVLIEHRTIDGVLYPFVYTYNPDDTLATATYPDGDVLIYEYDRAGFLNRLTSADVGVIVDDVILDAAGLVTERTLGAGTIEQRFCHSPSETTYRLTRASTAAPGVLGRCTEPLATSALHDVIYEHSASGSDRIIGRVEGYRDPSAGWVERSVAYEYDGRGRLENESYDDGTGSVDTDFANDEIGNLTAMGTVTQSYGSTGRAVRGAGPNAILQTTAGLSFTYDLVGNVKRIDDGADVYRLDYDARNRPLSVRKNGVLVGAYTYDEGGERVHKMSGGISTSYAGKYRVSSTRTETVYPGVGVKVNVGGVDTLHFTVSDPRGSTAMTIDAAGAVAQTVEYEPYGRLRVESVAAGAYDSDFLFNGKEQEAAFDTLSVTDFGPRLYLGDVGRWIGPDPTLSDGPNRYAFVRGDPINFGDPTGHGATELGVLAWELFGPGPEDAVVWGVGALVSQADSPAPGPADAVAVSGVAVGTVGVRGVRIAQRVYRKWDEIKVVKDGIISKAGQLRTNLKQYYDMSGLEAHHLAAKALPDFATARWVLDKVDIDIDDIQNGLPLPKSMHGFELHFNQDYVDDVNDMLLNAYTRGRTETQKLKFVEDALEDLRQRVLSGQYHNPIE
jgi:RHS repeat-associated protein